MIPRGLSTTLLAAVWMTAGASDLAVEYLPELPRSTSNNAVALLAGERGSSLFSFMGLGPGKNHDDIHALAWRLAPPARGWETLPEIPVGAGRLASIAVAAGGDVWLFGGYTVAADGSEVSTPEVHRWRLRERAWATAPDMPVPVDDATAFVYRDRYIYLVSGWHNLGNVNLVQVLDTLGLKWHQATPYPGHPVFGHAGGMSGRRMAVCGGVRIDYPPNGASRSFVPSGQCWLGEVDAEDFRRIGWRPLQPHPGEPRYRAAATADDRGRIVFAGGSANPYNFDGIGYNGVPSMPEAEVISLDLGSLAWRVHGSLSEPSMDHRSLLYAEGWYYLAGGMLAGQWVTDRVLRFRLND